MFRFLAKAVIATSLLTGGFIAGHGPSAAGATQSTFAPIGKVTSVPYGWVDFCQRYRGECDAGELVPADINLSSKAIKEIERVNQWVNSNIKPVSDMEHWGVVDQWDYPSDGKGDCEDYALLKRKLLIEEGLPRQALLMTVVKDLNNEGHAVLTIKTNKGEFVLDNMRDDVRPWTQTGYRFVKRQSQADQNVWVSIGIPTDAPAYVSR
jgi:predicted transglutaminase-like cysteine proteinase